KRAYYFNTGKGYIMDDPLMITQINQLLKSEVLNLGIKFKLINKIFPGINLKKNCIQEFIDKINIDMGRTSKDNPKIWLFNIHRNLFDPYPHYKYMVVNGRILKAHR
ncbi:MAG: hypothetical protein ACOCRK_03560, partial [bacterium]